MCAAIVDWLRTHEFIPIWLEGIALVAIFGLDWWEYRKQGRERLEQHKETAAQMEIWRKQIHSERVAEIFRVLRRFEHFVMQGITAGKIGPGRDFSEFGNISRQGGRIFQEYIDLQEAYYLSKLVSEGLFSYMKDRMGEADALQRTPNSEVFQNK